MKEVINFQYQSPHFNTNYSIHTHTMDNIQKTKFKFSQHLFAEVYQDGPLGKELTILRENVLEDINSKVTARG